MQRPVRNEAHNAVGESVARRQHQGVRQGRFERARTHWSSGDSFGLGDLIGDVWVSLVVIWWARSLLWFCLSPAALSLFVLASSCWVVDARTDFVRSFWIQFFALYATRRKCANTCTSQPCFLQFWSNLQMPREWCSAMFCLHLACAVASWTRRRM